MIDVLETQKQFGYNPNTLAKTSNKKVIAICEKCGFKRTIFKYAYRNICCKCNGLISIKKATIASAKSRLGKPRSEKTKQKMSLSHMGKKMPPISDITRQRLSLAKIGSKNPFYGKKHSEETKIKLSEISKKNPTHFGKPPAHGKHICYIKLNNEIVNFRSSWESKVALYLDQNNIEWQYENYTFPITYIHKNETRNGTFTPDFRILNKEGNEEFWEVKGFWRDDAKIKYETFCNQYPNLTIKLFDRQRLVEIGIKL